MRSRLVAFARLFPLALAFMVLAVCLGAAAPAGADAPDAPRALRALLVAEQAQLTAADGTAEDMFGAAVAISGDTVVVGAPMSDAGSSDRWRLGLRVRAQRRGLEPAGAPDRRRSAFHDDFGASVAISGDTVVVGAFLDDIGANRVGLGLRLVRSGSTWSQQAQLTAADGAVNDRFGGSVLDLGETVVVGAL